MSKHRARPRRLRRTGLVLSLSAVVVVAGATSAAAYWRAAGAGSGTAKTTTTQNLTGLTAIASVSSLIYPGATADLVLNVHNPNSRPVVVNAVAASGSATGCTTPAITVSATTGLPFTVPAGGDLAVTLTNAATMGTSASSDCQGIAISVPLTLTGKLS